MNYDKTNLFTSDDDTIAAYFILQRSYIPTKTINECSLHNCYLVF